VLEADAASGERRTPTVVIGSGGTLSVGTGIDDAALTLADGTTVALDVTRGRVDVPDPLPVGCHTLTLAGPGVAEATTIVTPPAEMPTSPALAGRAAMFAPAYALWEHDAPLPSFTHLASLGSMLPRLGVDALITLPLYAAFLDEPFDPSPYAPISRLHWNEAYLDDGGLPNAPVPPIGNLIDWRAVGRRRRAQLLDAVGTIPATLATEVRHWVAANPDIADYARFRAKVAVDPTDATRPTDVVEASHQLAQYLCHIALSQLHETGRAAFALDLPIGSHPLGYETWANPDLFATGMGVGAPPDTMYPDGQNWGFPPQLPGAAERSGFALWRAVVRRCGRYASLLRIDHVLGVHRLWWIPEGVGPDKGVYVRYSRTTLLAVIAAEAACAGTTVVGEDLGTVPEAITEAMQEWNMLGLYAEQTQLAAGSGQCPEDIGLPVIPARTVAGLRTHDMEPFAMLYARGDLVDYRRKLQRALGRPVGPSAAALLTATLIRLATSDAYLVFADLDDLLGEVTPHNIPGKVLPTIWRRRLRRPTSETLADTEVRRLLAVLTERPR
jgi:4-alpha-glucanotransferase